jgi:hypothetical protein
MSRLSGALGAVKGFHEGTVRRDQVLSTIDDALLNIQRFKSIEFPESQARVALSQAQTGLVEAASRATELSTDELAEVLAIKKELGVNEKFYEDEVRTLSAKITEEAGAKKVRRQAAEDVEAQAQALYNTELLKHQVDPIVAAQQQQSFIDEQFRQLQLKTQGLYTENQLNDVRRYILQTQGIPEARINLRLKQSQLEQARQLEDGLNAFKASQPELYQEFIKLPFTTAMTNFHNLQQKERLAEANATIQTAFAEIVKDNPLAAAPWYQNLLSQRHPQQYGDAVNAFLKLNSYQQKQNISTAGGIVGKDDAFKKAMSLSTMLLSTGKFQIGEEKALEFSKDLTPSEQKELVNGINQFWRLALEGSGEMMQLQYTSKEDIEVIKEDAARRAQGRLIVPDGKGGIKFAAKGTIPEEQIEVPEVGFKLVRIETYQTPDEYATELLDEKTRQDNARREANAISALKQNILDMINRERSGVTGGGLPSLGTTSLPGVDSARQNAVQQPTGTQFSPAQSSILRGLR